MNLSLRVHPAVHCALLLLFGAFANPSYGSPVQQHEVEAAMTFQLLSFTEWPEQEGRTTESPRVVGVFESATASSAFQALAEKETYKDRFTVIAVNQNTPTDVLKNCDAIFFDRARDKAIPRLMKKIGNDPIVLVGAFDGFLEQGGLVNLVTNQRRIGFEIQMENSKRRGIEYRAKLLRLAARIIGE